MPTRNINLTEHFNDFVDRQVSTGRYSNASEMVRHALHLLEEQERERKVKLHALREAAKRGFDEIDQGQGIVIKNKRALERLIKDVQNEALGKTRRASE
jgi:antitoxin ParD1/3/4